MLLILNLPKFMIQPVNTTYTKVEGYSGCHEKFMIGELKTYAMRRYWEYWFDKYWWEAIEINIGYTQYRFDKSPIYQRLKNASNS